jgi:hypothetical protein
LAINKDIGKYEAFFDKKRGVIKHALAGPEQIIPDK